jgi:hypothetical protein
MLQFSPCANEEEARSANEAESTLLAFPLALPALLYETSVDLDGNGLGDDNTLSSKGLRPGTAPLVVLDNAGSALETKLLYLGNPASRDLGPVPVPSSESVDEDEKRPEALLEGSSVLMSAPLS